MVSQYPTLEIEGDFGGERWIKYKRGVIKFEPTEKTKPGEYQLHVKLIGKGNRQKKNIA